ncbi:MAG: hypothetical protein V1648_02760 [Candidatus Aenigmatarchaeota archaeon]
MVKITLDHSAMIIYDRHPVIDKLKKLNDEGKLTLYHAQNLNRDLGKLNATEEKIYDRLRHMVYGRKQSDLNLTEHGDIVLMINHMKSKRDYFLTLEHDKYKSLRGHRNLDVRFPDEAFLKEIDKKLALNTPVKRTVKTKKTVKTGKKARKK